MGLSVFDIVVAASHGSKRFPCALRMTAEPEGVANLALERSIRRAAAIFDDGIVLPAWT